jgi:glyoxylase-like metal-dependent hydrolase (beta-lactamase superfamily II)
MNTRTFKTALFLLGLSASALVQALEVNFQPVAPDIYAHIGDTGGRTYENEALNANIGLVVTKEGALLIDSGASYQSARQIAEAALKVTPQPIKWVINSGGQDHRWLGNGYFKEKGTEILAHADARSDMEERGPRLIEANAPILKEKMEGTSPVLPDRWLSDSHTKLDLGGTSVEVIHLNGGHTPGDSLIWLPHSGVVFSGDIVYVDRILGMHPVSSTRAWLESFEALEALKPAIIVPGHGSLATLEKAQQDTGRLLRALRTHMQQSIDEGSDMTDAIKGFDGTPFYSLKHAEVWLPQLLNRTYLEVEME